MSEVLHIVGKKVTPKFIAMCSYYEKILPDICTDFVILPNEIKINEVGPRQNVPAVARL